MKPVDMLQMNDAEQGIIGDCFRACVASILEKPAAAVPHFAEHGSNWIVKTNEYLMQHGYLYFRYDLNKNNAWPWLTRNTGSPLFICGGKSPRGAFGHSVIGIYNREGFALVHDPHPSRAGIIGDPEHIDLLVRYDRI